MTQRWVYVCVVFDKVPEVDMAVMLSRLVYNDVSIERDKCWASTLLDYLMNLKYFQRVTCVYEIMSIKQNVLSRKSMFRNVFWTLFRYRYLTHFLSLPFLGIHFFLFT